MAVYRIPLRKVYNKKRISGDHSWEDIYGKIKCCKCHKPFAEGDPYQTVIGAKAKLQFAHVECA